MYIMNLMSVREIEVEIKAEGRSLLRDTLKAP